VTFSMTVLGCSGSYAEVGGACSGYLVRSDTTSIWVDAGPGTLANLQQHVSLDDVDAVVVTHEHPDHCGELAVLYNALKWYVGRTEVPLYSTSGVRGVVKASCGSTDDVFDWTILASGDEANIGDISLSFEQTDHSVFTLAVRLTHGDKSMVYTADTGPNWDLGAFAAGTDLLLGECTVLAENWHEAIPHLSAHQLGHRARVAEVERLLVTHIAPGADKSAYEVEAAIAFGMPAEAAVIHQTYSIGA